MKRTRRDKFNKALAYVIFYGGITLVLFGLLYAAGAFVVMMTRLPLYISLPLCLITAAILMWPDYKRYRRERD